MILTRYDVSTLCVNCGRTLNNHRGAYCSNKCQKDYEYRIYINAWKSGKVSGMRGKNTINFSQHIVRYLWKKYAGKCAQCGWSQINPVTKKPPLEIDHIDGNAMNNTEDNLILLCPNCHAITPTHKNLNQGNGRDWRRNRSVLQ